MEKCIFVGYPEGYKAWRFYNPQSRKFTICERAEFDETCFPGLSMKLGSQTATPHQPSSSVEGVLSDSLHGPDIDTVPSAGNRPVHQHELPDDDLVAPSPKSSPEPVAPPAPPPPCWNWLLRSNCNGLNHSVKTL
jgi:hypothetical protein